MAASPLYRFCPLCGGANGLSSNRCRQCQQLLPSSSLVGPLKAPRPTDPLGSAKGGWLVPIGTIGAVLGPRARLPFGLGIASSVLGIFLIVLARVFQYTAAVASCSGSLSCPSATLVFVALVGVGAGLMVLGILFLVRAFVTAFRDSPSLAI